MTRKQTTEDLKRWIEQLQSEIESIEDADEAEERRREFAKRRRAARKRLRRPLPPSLGQLERICQYERGKTFGPYWHHFWWDADRKKQRGRWIGKHLDQRGAEALAWGEYRKYTCEIRGAEVEVLLFGGEVEARDELASGMTVEEDEAYWKRVKELIDIACDEYRVNSFRRLMDEASSLSLESKKIAG